MEVNSFVTGFAVGKKNAKKPVLTELTVTENGVYDNPVIVGGLEPITWDGVVGDRVTTAGYGQITYVKVSDAILSADELLGAIVSLSNGNDIPLISDFIMQATGGVAIAEAMMVSVAEVEAFSESTSLNFSETGTYFAYPADASLYITSITFPSVPPTPADGWNKVTVNVAGDIIDVPELPTENIEEGKIYRVTKESEIEFWLSTSTFNKPLTEYVLDMTKVNMTFHVHVVESLPDAMEPMDQTTFTVPSYVVESTGIAYISADGTSANANPLSSALGFPMTDGGWVDSVDDIVYPGETTVYTVRGQSSTTYGIPDAHPVKRLVDGAWVELA